MLKVTLTEYADNETMLAQVSAGVAYDVVVPSDYMVSIMKGADLLVKLNQAAIPNLDSEYRSPLQGSIVRLWQRVLGSVSVGNHRNRLSSYGSIDDSDGVSWAVIFDADVSAANAGLISYARRHA